LCIGYYVCALKPFMTGGLLRDRRHRKPEQGYSRFMAEHSAGVLLHRDRDGRTELLLVHPGGPLWTKRDEGSWSAPKGLYDPETEDALSAARREFEEETGQPAAGEFADLGVIRQPSGKRVRLFALEGDFDVAALRSNTFEMEWPPKSGRRAAFPEVDRGAWFDLDTARRKIVRVQVAFLDRLAALLPRLRVGG
jgi:predicted NUDIX family NTP pyrophosphohydrolase